MDGLIDNGEKLASSEKHTQIKTRVQTSYLFMTKMSYIDVLFMTQTTEKPYPLGPRIPALFL